MGAVAPRAVGVVRAVLVPVAVHLGERAEVGLAAVGGSGLVQLDQVVVPTCAIPRGVIASPSPPKPFVWIAIIGTGPYSSNAGPITCGHGPKRGSSASSATAGP